MAGQWWASTSYQEVLIAGGIVVCSGDTRNDMLCILYMPHVRIAKRDVSLSVDHYQDCLQTAGACHLGD